MCIQRVIGRYLTVAYLFLTFGIPAHGVESAKKTVLVALPFGGLTFKLPNYSGAVKSPNKIDSKREHPGSYCFRINKDGKLDLWLEVLMLSSPAGRMADILAIKQKGYSIDKVENVIVD